MSARVCSLSLLSLLVGTDQSTSQFPEPAPAQLVHVGSLQGYHAHTMWQAPHLDRSHQRLHSYQGFRLVVRIGPQRQVPQDPCAARAY